MGPKSILMFVMVLLSSCAQAQTERAKFDSAVNYVNCKVIQLSLMGQGDAEELFKKECNCDNIPDFSSIKAGLIGGPVNTVKLADEINTIKDREFKDGFESQDIIKLLTKTIFSNADYKRIKDYANNRKNDPAFNSLKDELRKTLTNMYQPINTPDIGGGSTIPTGTKQNDSLQKSINALIIKVDKLEADADRWYNSLPFQIALIAGISVLVFFAIKFITVISNDEEDVSNEIKKYVALKISNKEFNTGNVTVSDIRELKDDIRKVESKIMESNNYAKKTDSNREIPQQYEQPKSFNKEENISFSSPEVLYFSTPNEDGSFNESSASASFRDDATIYRMTKTSATKAELKIDDKQSSMRLALQYPELRIERCCIPQNAFNPNAKRIVTTKPGKMELIGDKWIIVTKAKISYED